MSQNSRFLGALLKTALWRAGRGRVPQVDGRLYLYGLMDRVDVSRDRWGLARIQAHSRHDLFLAQGFVPAQERANTKLSEIAAAVAEVSFAQSPTDQPEALQRITQTQQDALARHNLIEILDETQTADIDEKSVEKDNQA